MQPAGSELGLRGKRVSTAASASVSGFATSFSPAHPSMCSACSWVLWGHTGLASPVLSCILVLLLLGLFSCVAANFLALEQKLCQICSLRASCMHCCYKRSHQNRLRRKSSSGNRPVYKSAEETHVCSQGSLDIGGEPGA